MPVLLVASADDVVISLLWLVCIDYWARARAIGRCRVQLSVDGVGRGVCRLLAAHAESIRRRLICSRSRRDSLVLRDTASHGLRMSPVDGRHSSSLDMKEAADRTSETPG